MVEPRTRGQVEEGPETVVAAGDLVGADLEKVDATRILSAPKARCVLRCGVRVALSRALGSS
jgi:hypothetical protein